MTRCKDCGRLEKFIIYTPNYCSNCRSRNLNHFEWIDSIIYWIGLLAAAGAIIKFIN